ncbi:hypothetical protein QFZ52_002166 [Arthrobacter woluwensis]|uniref:hypothetical protein n=1 Tax=Arthrobacter woluwensis TaxID=156980 RepID=UPI00277E797F|nr:hypothetical protein [Arthrobacter woluwensis]MDQ0709514.1 hypothetical protein [Arthrobacter woluwensis]
MVTSPLHSSPSLRRRLFPSLARFIPRHTLQPSLSPRERDLLRDRLDLEYRARKEAETVRREVELARAQARTVIH